MNQVARCMLLCVCLLTPGTAWCFGPAPDTNPTGVTTLATPNGDSVMDESLNASRVTSVTTQAGEDVTNDVQKVESRFLTIPGGGTTARISADQLYRSGPGFLESITCNSDATATAGTIAVLDNTAAGAGNVLYQLNVEAVAYATPFTVPLHTPFSVGLYLDFTTTADMFCTLVYR